MYMSSEEWKEKWTLHEQFVDQRGEKGAYATHQLEMKMKLNKAI